MRSRGRSGLLDLRGAAERPQFPRHHVEVAIVQYNDDQTRIGPFTPIFGDGDETVDAEHLHGAVANKGDRHPIWKTEFGRGRVGHAAAHRCQRA